MKNKEQFNRIFTYFTKNIHNLCVELKLNIFKMDILFKFSIRKRVGAESGKLLTWPHHPL